MAACVASLGEAMVELAPVSDGHYRLAFGGDAFNTAVYLARCGTTSMFLSRVGDDAFSDRLRALLHAEGVDGSALQRQDRANLGLYLISIDEDGERSFRYWRGESPARHMFEALTVPTAADVVYLTGISVAVGRRGSRGDDAVIDFLERARAAQKRIAFDPNVRPSLWPSLDVARSVLERVYPLCDLVFPTLADEALLYGDASIKACEGRYTEAGVSECVLKCGGGQVCAFVEGERNTFTADMVSAVDSTAAGDAFNAGYLAARLRGDGTGLALAAGARVARHVVRHRGAITPRKAWKLEMSND